MGPGPVSTAYRNREAGRRRAARVGLIAVAGFVVLLAINAWPAVRDHFRDPVTWVGAPKRAGARVVPTAPPPEYRVVYRVDAGSPVGTVVRTETLEVLRPWQSRLTTRAGAPPGRAITDVRSSDFGKLDVRATGQAESVFVVQPDIAGSDLRLDVDLPALIAANGVEVRERRVVDGVACQVYRTSAPPQGQTIGKIGPAPADVVDSCVDGHGIIRAQLQFFRGKLLFRKRAVRVDPHPTFGDHELVVTAESTVPTNLGGGAIAPVDADSAEPPGTTYYLDGVPSGFTKQGSYAVAPSQPPNSGGLPQGNRRGSFVDVWVNGVDVLMLDQGGFTFGGDALGALPLGHEIDAGPLGTGRAQPGPRLSQAAVTLADGRYVRLIGTLPVAQLTRLLATLRRVDR